MPCLSSNADSDLKESIRVSNAESQLALPFMMTTVFGASMICSPNGSAVWSGAAAGGGVAGVSAAAGGVVGAAEGPAAGAGVAVGGGAGVAGAPGAVVVTAGGAAGGGDCASALPRPSEIAAAGTSATMARRKERGKFIQYSP